LSIVVFSECHVKIDVEGSPVGGLWPLGRCLVDSGGFEENSHVKSRRGGSRTVSCQVQDGTISRGKGPLQCVFVGALF